MAVELNLAKAEYRSLPVVKASEFDLISLLLDFLLSIFNAIGNIFVPEVEKDCMANLKEKALSWVKALFASYASSKRDYTSIKCLFIIGVTLGISTLTDRYPFKALAFFISGVVISSIIRRSPPQKPPAAPEDIRPYFYQFKALLRPEKILEPDLETGIFNMTFSNLKGKVGQVSKFGIQEAEEAQLELQNTISGTIDYQNKAILFDGDGIKASWSWFPGHIKLKKIQISEQGFKLCGFHQTLFWSISCQTPIYSIDALAETSVAISWK